MIGKLYSNGEVYNVILPDLITVDYPRKISSFQIIIDSNEKLSKIVHNLFNGNKNCVVIFPFVTTKSVRFDCLIYSLKDEDDNITEIFVEGLLLSD